METKFTKGEWTIDYGQTIGHIKAVNINDLSKIPTVAIYNVFSRHGKESLTKIYEEQENANAKLIAAAPDLFKALNSIVLSVKSHPDYVFGKDEDEWHDLISISEKAIKKAIE